MNQSGWGLKDFLLILGIITLSLLIVAALYRRNFTNTTEKAEVIKEEEKETYQDLEYKLQRAAERYQNDNYQGNYESTETWILSYKLLKEENYLKEKITDINDKSIECDGYVKFKKQEINIDYTPYLKCGDYYTTKGYEEKYEE